MAHPRFIDIGSNLSDPVFLGEYHGKQVHRSDFGDVIIRARNAGVRIQILTGGNLESSTSSIEMARKEKGFFATVGLHPCSAYEMNESPSTYLESLSELIKTDQALPQSDRRIVAIGETGLDYDRLMLCDKASQLLHFPPQLRLAKEFNLPLFLHCRHPEAHIDFVRLVREENDRGEEKLRGVVHSHSGSLEEAREMIALGFYIGINGCSLKTQENLDCVAALPLDKLMLESDCPYCDIRPSHASFPYLATLPPHLKELYLPASYKKDRFRISKCVKGRNEPCAVGTVAWVVAKLHGVTIEEVAEQAWKNTIELFGSALDVQVDEAIDIAGVVAEVEVI